MWKLLLLILLGFGVVLAGLVVYGSYRWQKSTRILRTRLETSRIRISPKFFDERELYGLPLPVQRYVHTALKPGQPMISAARIQHVGTFNISETGEQWKPFTSDQRVITRRPGFDWDARIAMLSGLAVRVHDAYIAGEGMLQASLLGVLTLADMHGTPEAAQGELMRFLAEAAWYPTALLPSQGARWGASDNESARVTLGDGPTTVTLLFRFNGAGLIESVYADARGRAVKNTVVPTPWEGRWLRYERHDEMLIPTEGEVAWLLPEGRKPYWRGRLTRIEYEFER